MSNPYNNYPYQYPYPGRPAPVDKGIGWMAFIILMIATSVVALYYLGLQIFIPCNVPGGTFQGGWYDCNSHDGDSAMFGWVLFFAAYTFLLLPAVGIMGVVAIIKNHGKKWGEWTIGLITVGIFIVPMLYLFISGTIKF